MNKIFNTSATLAPLVTKLIDNSNLIHGDLEITRFKDKSEYKIDILTTVRNQTVYVVGNTSDANDLMKLLLTINALKNGSANKIIGVIPYFGYSRQDKQDSNRSSHGAKVVAKLLESVGLDELITIDLHADQIKGFFNIPVNAIQGHYIFINKIKSMVKEDLINLNNVVFASPDAGGLKRAEKYVDYFSNINPNVGLVFCSKKRDKANSIERMELIGDVNNKTVIFIDDIIDTGGTLSNAVNLVTAQGANESFIVAAHPVFSNGYVEKLISNKNINTVLVTDSIPKQEISDKTYIVSCYETLLTSINSIDKNQSMTDNFNDLIM